MPARLTATTAHKHSPAREKEDMPPDLVPSARTLDRIARFDGEGLPVVSVYLAVTGGPDARRAIRTKADSLLHRDPLSRRGPLARSRRPDVASD